MSRVPRIGWVSLNIAGSENTFVAADTAARLRFIATELLYGERLLLKALPVDLPVRPWPVAIVTLKNRTLNPVVERFIECARDVSKSFSREPTGRSARSPK